MCCFLQGVVNQIRPESLLSLWAYKNEANTLQSLLKTDIQQDDDIPQNVNHGELLLAVPPGGQSCQCSRLPQFCLSACVQGTSVSMQKPQAITSEYSLTT